MMDTYSFFADMYLFNKIFTNSKLASHEVREYDCDNRESCDTCDYKEA